MRSNNESHKRGVGGKRSSLLANILDHPICQNLCAGCGHEIPDPWYHPSGKCWDCEEKERAEQRMADQLFSEVINLEAERDALLSIMAEVPLNQEQEKRLADIETDLQGHYAFFGDVELGRQSRKYGVAL